MELDRNQEYLKPDVPVHQIQTGTRVMKLVMSSYSYWAYLK